MEQERRNGTAIRIGVTVPAEWDHFRGVALGAARYCSAHSLSPMLIGMQGETLPDLSQFRLDGIVISVFGPEMVDGVVKHGIPAINVSSNYDCDVLPRVLVDDDQVGQMAAQYFLGQGFKHLAFLGIAHHGYSRDRRAGFERVLTEAGITCHAFEGGEPTDWSGQLERFGRWLRDMPKPLGVLACNDMRARSLVHACQEVSLDVPGEVSILGVDNGDLLCQLTDPAISSIDTSARMVGETAARLLHQHIALGEPIPPLTRIAPTGLVARGSTGMRAAVDPDVGRALTLINERAGERMNVEGLLKNFSMSRRTLERRFREALGRSPAEELRRVRLDLAKRLLVDTDLSLPEVASRSGFDSDRLLRMVFRRELNLTPSEFRTRFRKSVPA
ncbi:MAG: substrate-binding domain-containing protein [Phycisphaeraceae bacterium]|nr:substrate-binding domain-containing protein [Phycisphaeraceae bacterium]